MIGLRLSCATTRRTALRQGQRHVCKLLLELNIKDGTLENPSRGFEGMLAANEILREREAVGILIGGLAEAVWNRNVKNDDLKTHKDVDVLVTGYDHRNPVFELNQPFEAGIDWWLPRTERITIRRDGSSEEKDQTWFENGNCVKLNFGMTLTRRHMSPGLYLPSPELVRKMRLYEALASVNLDVEGDVQEAFDRQVAKRMKTQLPRFIRGKFFRADFDNVGLVEFHHDLVRSLLEA